MILHMVQDGDWYWSGPRTGRRPKNQCFLNATERRQVGCSPLPPANATARWEL